MNESLREHATTPQRPWYRLTIRRAMALVVVAALVSLVPRVGIDERETARWTHCRNNLILIGLALSQYHEAYDCFPPAYVAGPDGTPWHSWRVLIGPRLDAGPVWSRYDFGEPWNGPHNRTLFGATHNFTCPSRRDGQPSTFTNYVMIVGPGTAFPGAGSTRYTDVRDGLDQTIAVVECADLDIPWNAPVDLDLATLSLRLNDPKRSGPSSWHPAGVNVLFLDGSFATLKMNVTPAQLKAMLTVDGKD